MTFTFRSVLACLREQILFCPHVVDFLLSGRADRALEEVGLTRSRDLDTMKNVQFIELGPELLVYLDAVKRSRFLDTWFQLVIQD